MTTVSAISADGKTLTVGTTYSGAPSYAVDATSARIIGALKQKKLSDIKVNDTVTVIGQLTAANTVTANSITDSTQN